MARAREILILSVVVFGILAALVWRAGWLGHKSHAAHVRTTPVAAEPTPVKEVPSHLPPNGVSLDNGSFFLRPWASTPTGAMSADQAIAAARRLDHAHRSLPATALEADVTYPSSRPDIPVWLVTFVSPKLIPAGHGARGTHFSDALNPVTGKLVTSFFAR